MVIQMINIFIGLVIGIIINNTIIKLKRKDEHDYSELIKRCIEEANADLSNCGKKKHSNKG